MENRPDNKYKLFFLSHPFPALVIDPVTNKILEVNPAAEKQYNYTKKEFFQMNLSNLFLPEEFTKFIRLKTNKGPWINLPKNKGTFFAEIRVCEVSDEQPLKIFTIIDVTAQKMAEIDFKKKNDKYQFLTEETFDAIWDWDLITDKLNWNESAKKMFEINTPDEIDVPEWWTSNLHPDDKARVQQNLNNHLQLGLPNWHDEYRFRTGSGKYKYISDRGYLVCDENKKPLRMVGAMQDLTKLKAHEITLQTLNDSLEKRAKELAESNEELERFAYVASHDLQEPLRMVSSFLQLLEKRYKDKLDKKAHEYIAYAVDGAERMKKLILDLLEYSKVNTSAANVEQVNLNDTLNDVLFTYKNALVESNGIIQSHDLPVVSGNKTQLLQVLQNLIGNAIKYRSEKPPAIIITCEEENSFYQICIADNGIGIDPRFYNKIFVIFQRLHTREQYSGTGIGLSICKKIIEKHGGKLWVSSVPGQGSKFYFTLPNLHIQKPS